MSPVLDEVEEFDHVHLGAAGPVPPGESGRAGERQDHSAVACGPPLADPHEHCHEPARDEQRDDRADDPDELPGKRRSELAAQAARDGRGQHEHGSDQRRRDESRRMQPGTVIHAGCIFFITVRVTIRPYASDLPTRLRNGRCARPGELRDSRARRRPVASTALPDHGRGTGAPGAGDRDGVCRHQPRQPADADRTGVAHRRSTVLQARRKPGAGRDGGDHRRRPRTSAREPARPAGRRVLGAAVRERLHEIRPRRRQDSLAAHGSVGGPELEALAWQHPG